MEYGVRLTAPSALPDDPRHACPSAWRELLPDGAAVALYFGTEFCEDRLPDIDEAMAYCALARDRNWEPTLLTPIVSSDGLRAIRDLVSALVARGAAPAIVFNDWGVLALLREAFPSLARRAGRLMNRSLRDPRAYRDAPERCASHDAPRFVRLRTFLADVGVTAIETDVDLEGGYLSGTTERASGTLRRALHLPFTFAASGRSCPLKAALYPPGQAFTKALAERCPVPCRGKALPVRRADAPLPFWRAGNTVFYEVPMPSAAAWLAQTDRIVLHATPAP